MEIVTLMTAVKIDGL